MTAAAKGTGMVNDRTRYQRRGWARAAWEGGGKRHTGGYVCDLVTHSLTLPLTGKTTRRRLQRKMKRYTSPPRSPSPLPGEMCG